MVSRVRVPEVVISLLSCPSHRADRSARQNACTKKRDPGDFPIIHDMKRQNQTLHYQLLDKPNDTSIGIKLI
jgi:hypothetical protein